MTEQELLDDKSISIEPYRDGFILADYSGRAVYCGSSLRWSSQPNSLGPVFATKEDAVAAVN